MKSLGLLCIKGKCNTLLEPKLKFIVNFFQAVLVALGNCGPCANKDDIKLYDRNNLSNPVCWPFPKCNDGQESTVKPGSSHPHGTKIACINCHEGYFSNNHTNKRCRRCTSCVNNKELSPCEGSRDRQCSNSCISNNFYFNSTDQQCYPCTECCGASDEDIELQCVSRRVGTVVGGNGEKHCKASFKLSQQCSNEPPLERNVSSSPACANSSVTNSSSLEARECSCGSSFSIDSLHIALISVLGLVLPIVLLFGYRWCVSRRQSSRSGYTGMPLCIPNYTGKLQIKYCITGADWEGLGNRVKEREGGREREHSTCNKSPNWYKSAVAGSHEILISRSDMWRKRPPFNKFYMLQKFYPLTPEVDPDVEVKGRGVGVRRVNRFAMCICELMLTCSYIPFVLSLIICVSHEAGF